MRWKLLRITVSLAMIVLLQISAGTASAGEISVMEDGASVFIIDSLGVKWDVTQARSIGFDPNKFQFGLGRNAFVTLDDSLLTGDLSGVPDNLRIIGISEGNDSKAYSVLKLRRHETSNSELNGKPVAVAY